MIDFGTVRPGTTLIIPFNTYDSNDPAASVTITGLATTDIEIYKDGSVTQRASDAGYTLLDTDGIDFDGTTGIHGISVDLSNNTTAGFYAAGAQYFIVIASITVDAGTVNFIAARFTIGYPDAILNTTIATLASQTSFTLTAGPAEDDALNGRMCVIHDVASKVQVGHAVISDYVGSTKTVTLAAGTTFTVAATDNISIMGLAPLQATTPGNTLDVTTTGAAGIDWANVENPTTALNLSGTNIDTDQVVASVSGNVDGSVASVTAINTTAGAVDNVTLTDTITTYTGDTPQTGDAFLRLATFRLGELMSAVLASQPFTGSLFGDLTQDNADDSGTQQFTTNALMRTWDRLSTGSLINNSFGKILRDLKSLLSETAAINDASATTTSFITTLTSAVDDFYIDQTITMASGQSRVISAYVGSTKRVTVDEALSSAPADSSEIQLKSDHVHSISMIVEGVWDALTSALTTASSIGKLIVDNLNATISSRANQTSVDDVPTTAEFEARTIPAADYFDPATDEVDADIKKINAVTIIGDGSGTPFDV